FFAALLYLPQFMETELGFSPLEAGLGMLPALATFALVSFVAGPLYARLGSNPLAVLEAGRLPAPALLFSLVDAHSPYSAPPPATAAWYLVGPCSGWGSAAATRPRPPPGSPRSTNRVPAWRAGSSTCSRSAVGRSASG